MAARAAGGNELNPRKILLLSAVALAVPVLQAALFNHLIFAGGIIHLILLYVIWTSASLTRFQALPLAAVMGFIADASSDLWGLHLFSMVLTIYLFHPVLVRFRQNRYLLWQIALVLLLIVFTHNSILIFVSLFAEQYASGFSAVTKLTSDTLMTTGFGVIIYLLIPDK